MKILAFTLLFVLTPTAHLPAQPTLRDVYLDGVVRDASTGVPLPEVKVLLVPGRNFRYNQDQPGTLTVQTTVDGTYRFAVDKPGVFWLYASAEGYVPGSNLPQFLSLRKSASVQIELVKAPSIEGRVVDQGTRQPIRGIKVTPMRAVYKLGQPTPELVLPPVEGTTDANGNFRLDNLKPGSYTFELDSPAAEVKVAEADAEVLEADHRDEPARSLVYRQQWWPSGSRLDLNQTIALSPGVHLILPDIRISKEPVAQISGLLYSGSCSDGDLYGVSLTRQFGAAYITDSNAAVHCGSAFTVTNLAPGDYQLSAVPRDTRSSRGGTAWEVVTVSDRDVRRDLYPAPPIMISGTVSLPDGFKPAFPLLSLNADPLWGVGLGSPQSFPISLTDKSFVVSLSSTHPVQLKMFGLDPPYYVSSILYSGSQIPDSVLTPQPYSAGQSLQIIVSNDSGSVQGTVSDGDAMAPAATVVILPWPLRRPNNFPIHSLATTDQSGNFRLAGLPPGEYRIFSVSAAAWDAELQKPGLVEALASDGDSVSISPGITAAISLALKHVSLR